MIHDVLDQHNTIFLIDGSSFLYRAYYSLRPLHTSTGQPVQAVYGFCRMLKKLLDTVNPHLLALVWDSRGKTARHELYTEYKATRQEAPSDLSDQKELIREFAQLIGLAQIERPGVEADDLMFSLARIFEEKKLTTVLVGGDKDFGQVLSEHIVIYDPFKEEYITQELFVQKMGFAPEKLPFYFALLGDVSDNIPGVKGIGKKGATDLVQQFNSLADLYQNIDAVKNQRTRNLLIEQKNNALLSEKLFLPQYQTLNIQKEDLHFDKSSWVNAIPFFQKLQFKSLLHDADKVASPVQKEYAYKKHDLRTVTTLPELQEIVHAIKKHKIFAIDTELDGGRVLQDQVIGLCICVTPEISYYIPFGHKVDAQQLKREEVFSAFQPLFEDPIIKKIMHHAKFDQLGLAHYGIICQGLSFDTLIAAHLVTQDWQRIGLKYLSEYYLKESMLHFDDVVSANNFKNFSQVPLDLATQYAAMDSLQTLRLYPIMEQLLNEQNMHNLYYDLEHPLIEVLFDMELEGIRIDTNVLQEIDKKVSHQLTLLKKDLLSLIGNEYESINFNSPKQLAELLFEHLKLPPQKKTSGKSGYSTDQEVLETLAELHPVPALIIKYRELFKLKSTYIDALPTFINPETGKIHTTFSQTAVATGRLASYDPNVQNIPTDAGIRAAFKPDEGKVFISADYSQIELRVLAFLSQDKTLIEAFLHDEDIHQKTAAKIFDIPLEKVTNKERQVGKRINFSIMYGLTPYGLSKDLKIPFSDAKKYIDKYFAQYPQVLSWMDSVIEQTKKDGFVTTYMGRRRYIPGIYEKNKTLYELAKRVAINTAAQGTAAELMKKGMITLHRLIKNQKLPAKLLLQIHDELLISIPKDQADYAAQEIKKTLETIVDWNVPLKVSTRIGNDWQEVTK